MSKHGALIELLIERHDATRIGKAYNSMEAGRQACLYHFPDATFTPDPDTTRTQSEVITHPDITWGRVLHIARTSKGGITMHVRWNVLIAGAKFVGGLLFLYCFVVGLMLL